MLFAILDKRPLLGSRNRELAGRQSEGAWLLSTGPEQDPYPWLSILHLREPFLTAALEGWHADATTLNLCNNKLYLCQF